MDGPTPRSPRLRSLPRESWAEHPHFPSQVLLLGSHDSFRRLSWVLVDHAKKGEQLDWIAIVYPQWIAAMRSHEAYEEHKLYPYLTRRWGLSFEAAEEGHRRLHAHDAVIRELLADLDAPDVASSLHAELRANDTTLNDHLDLEEELVIPALLELEPQEFEDYRRMTLPELIRWLDAHDGRYR